MSIKDFARIEFLKNTEGFTNYAGNIVKVVQETETEVYYYDSFRRYCYLPKSEEGVSYRYIPKGVRANKRLHSDASTPCANCDTIGAHDCSEPDNHPAIPPRR